MKNRLSASSNIFSAILILCCLPTCSFGQPTAISGTLNTYGEVTLVDTALNLVSLTDPAFAASLSLNDLVMLYQTQGANIISGIANSGFGSISSLNGAGSFEFGRVCRVDGSDVAIDNKLLNTYYDPAVSDASIQMIKVPEYTDAEVIGTLTAGAWDGNTGGVLALSVLDTLYINGTIQMSEKGFRGGVQIRNTTGPLCNFLTVATNYAYASAQGPLSGASKGEGIAHLLAGQEYGRGPQANGGGGGNGHNSGGAGGGNGSIGGQGGERVGSFFACPGEYPGLPGKALLSFGYTPGSQRAFLGGAGGAGDDNNGQSGDGGNGGGLILLIANVITGTGSIESNGGSVAAIGSDGNGGGGAGGSILLNANIIQGVGLTMSARGGNGGHTSINCEGPGGGGSGGVIWSSTALGTATTDVTGGAAGQAQACAGNPQNAAAGGVGQVFISGLAPPQGTLPVPCVLQTEVHLFSRSQNGRIHLSWEYPGERVAGWFLQKFDPSLGWQRTTYFDEPIQSHSLLSGGRPKQLRIEALHSDGRSTLSNQILIDAESEALFLARVDYEGPHYKLVVSGLMPDRLVSWSVFDLNGRERLRGKHAASARIFTMDLPVDSFPSGYYSIQIFHAGISSTLPLLILR